MNTPLDTPVLLLIEPHYVMRRTMVAVAKDLKIAHFLEVTSIDLARPLLATTRFDGIVIDVSDLAAAVALIKQLREGAFVPDPGVAIIAMSADLPDSKCDRQLLLLDAVSIVHKPFKLAQLFGMLPRANVGTVATSQAA